MRGISRLHFPRRSDFKIRNIVLRCLVNMSTRFVYCNDLSLVRRRALHSNNPVANGMALSATQASHNISQGLCLNFHDQIMADVKNA